MMKYIVFKSEYNRFMGFTSVENYHLNKEFLDEFLKEENETIEEFEGPEYDDTDETFNKVKEMAKALCKEDNE